MIFLCIDIMNSNRADWQNTANPRDMLEDNEWLQRVLKKWGLHPPQAIDTGSLRQLQKLRREMQLIVSQLQDQAAAQSVQLTRINKLLGSMPTIFQLNNKNNTFALEDHQQGSGWALVIWSVAYSFARLLSKQEVSRIKVCDNNACRWVFYDQSKNKSRRWCDEKVCGNIMKVRNFRARQKEKEV